MSQKTSKKTRKLAKMGYAMLSDKERVVVTFKEFYKGVKKEMLNDRN